MNIWNRFTNAVLEFFLVFRIRSTIHRMQDDLSQREHQLLTATNNSLDQYIDQLLTRIDRDIQTYNQNHGRVGLPNIEEQLPSKTWLTGEFKAWNGWFEDITSIGRIGPCRLQKRISENRFVLELSLTLRNLTIGYSNYQIRIGSAVKRRGTVGLKVNDNSLLLRIYLPSLKNVRKENSADKKVEKPHLHQVLVTKLENIQVNVTGCYGKLGNMMAKKVILWMINEHMDIIKERIESAVTDCIQDTINRALRE